MTESQTPVRKPLDPATFDPKVRAQDDLFRHVHGPWLDSAPIPDDKPMIGAFRDLTDDAEIAVRDIITSVSPDDVDAAADPDTAKIATLYASFMDTDTVEAAGAEPIADLLAEVDAVTDFASLVELNGRLNRIGVGSFVDADVESDPGNPNRMLLFVGQSGLGLPDEAYYRADEHAETREKYLAHLGATFALAGLPDPDGQAAAVLDLETRIAAAHWDRVKRRDMVAMYNLMPFTDVVASAPALELPRFFAAAGVSSEALAEVVNAQPSFFADINALASEVPLSAWQSWLRWNIVRSFSAYLSDDFVQLSFSFYGKVLTGTTQVRERWKRGVGLVEGSLGEAVGRVYVERHFSPRAKERMDVLVANLIEAYRQSIVALDWMTEETKAKALDKLGKFTPKIGFPAKWRDYSGLTIGDDLVANVRAVHEFDHDWMLAKVGKPVDKDEWLMTPQTVNAYYHPLRNEIVFPAAILQPPFFDETADDAVNYGGIGAVIGHEIGHGFDDQGSTCDGDGRLVNWWTDDDRAAFEKRTSVLIEQYGQLEPKQTPGHKVNGELTIGENIGDLGGLGIAYKAWQIAGGGGEPIDGLTPQQRLFLSWANVWQTKGRDEIMLTRLATDPHSPAEFRCNQIVRNINEFYEAFGLTSADELWLDEEQRVQIW